MPADGEHNRGSLSVQIAECRADVRSLGSQVNKLSDRVDSLATANSRLAVQCEGLAAETRALVSTAREDIKTLFRLDGEKNSRVTAIEKDYLPKREFETHVASNAADHAEHRDAVSKLNISVAKIVATTAIIVSLLQTLIQYAGPALKEMFK